MNTNQCQLNKLRNRQIRCKCKSKALLYVWVALTFNCGTGLVSPRYHVLHMTMCSKTVKKMTRMIPSGRSKPAL